jgi:hypothetical protein
VNSTGQAAAVRVPDFFLVGAAKAGTTSLFQYLIQHPSIYIPDIKEPHYFSEYYDRGASYYNTIADYLRLFSACPEGALAGDASTSYLYSVTAAERIRELNPQAKIMAVLRNPVDRAYSFYWYNRRNFVEELSFEDALQKEPERITEGAHYRFHYVRSGIYSPQVQRYIDAFGHGSVRIYLFEDLRDAPALVRDIFSFLGVNASHFVDTHRQFNPSGPVRSPLLGRFLQNRFPRLRRTFPGTARTVKHTLMRYNVKEPPPMSATARRQLTRVFHEDILRLESMLDRDLSHWL